MTDAIHIGAVSSSDHDALVVLMRDTWTAAFAADMDPRDVAIHLATKLSPEAIRGYIADFSFLIAHDGAQAVGFIQYGAAEPHAPGLHSGDREIRRLYVAASHQNRGIGSRLLQTALSSTDMANAPRVLIDVWEGNHGAKRLYARFGFSPVGRIPFTVDGRVLGYDQLLARSDAARR